MSETSCRWFLPATKTLHANPSLWERAEVQVGLCSGYPDNVLVDDVKDLVGLQSLEGVPPVTLAGKRHVDDGVQVRFYADNFTFEIDLSLSDKRRNQTFDGYLVALAMNRPGNAAPWMLAPLVFIMEGIRPISLAGSNAVTVQSHRAGMLVLNSGHTCVWCHRPLGPIESIGGTS